MFTEAIQDILNDTCDTDAVRAIEAGGTDDMLWAAIESAGFLELLTPESRGGGGISLKDAYPILALLGAHAVPSPVAQSIVARMLVDEGVLLPRGRITLAGTLHKADDTWTCIRVPFGTTAEHVVAARRDGSLVLLETVGAQRVPSGVYGCFLADLVWSRPPEERFLSKTGGGAGGTLQLLGAATHAALLSGAIGRVFELTLQYANDRVQFGKAIGKFQAVQQQMSVMAETVAAATVSAQLAFQPNAVTPGFDAAAIAKSRCSEAGALIASIAHAVHGAIGVTQEYELQLLTRRLHEWRMQDGSDHYWNTVLGRRLLANPGMNLAHFAMAVTDAA